MLGRLSVPGDGVRGQAAEGAGGRERQAEEAAECLAAIPDTSILGHRVARKLTALIERRGKPEMIVEDNGTELTSNAIMKWSAEYKSNGPPSRPTSLCRMALWKALPVGCGRGFERDTVPQPCPS